jgi:hypothetical protein
VNLAEDENADVEIVSLAALWQRKVHRKEEVLFLF